MKLQKLHLQNGDGAAAGKALWFKRNNRETRTRLTAWRTHMKHRGLRMEIQPHKGGLAVWCEKA